MGSTQNFGFVRIGGLIVHTSSISFIIESIEKKGIVIVGLHGGTQIETPCTLSDALDCIRSAST